LLKNGVYISRMTYAELYEQAKTDLASGEWMTKSYTYKGRQKTMISIAEMQEYILFLKTMAGFESGDAVTRTTAYNGGRP